MCRCGEGTIATEGARVSRAVTQRCRAWTCDECEPRRRSQLTALGFAGRPRAFLTFTMPPTPGEPELAFAHRLTAAFRVWLKLVKRKYPKQRLEYLAVMHAHKSGYAHLHLLSRGIWFDHAWAVEKWNRLTQATRLDMRVPKSRGDVASYVAGYTAGKTAKFGNLKRYWQSKGWDKRKRRSKREGLDPDETWHSLQETLPEWAQRYVLKRWQFRWERDGYAIAERPP